jgi:hypothetical protein
MRRKVLARFLIAIAVVVGAGFAWVIIGRLTAPKIDGIPCVASEQLTYHVHAHLTIVDSGKRYTPPGNIGISLLHLCLYWLHTHDDSGIIHIEAPNQIAPTLGNFFDIWGQPLSRRQVWHFTVNRGHSMRVFVGHQLITGDPRSIKLFFHTIVTVEIGPPFVAVPQVNWHGL